MGSLVKLVVGTAGSDARTYSIADVNVGDIIDDAKWTTIFNSINTERARRGHGAISNPGFTPGTLIQANDYNVMQAALHVDGPVNPTYKTTSNTTLSFARASAAHSPDPGNKSVGEIIRAWHINQLIDALQNQGAECVCNCNYCTCNCNYCTCNCNYACTCNCNYSDKRLKTDITFVGMINELKVYTFKYIWDKVTTHRGVMAQELVGTKYEDALSVDKDGYYMVDYNKIPV